MQLGAYGKGIVVQEIRIPERCLIPYISIHSINIGPVVISPFGVMVGMAVIAGVWLSMWRGR